jgi:CBS-domain-containing membrane protein
MRVEQLMSRNIHTCDAEADLNRVAQLMWEHDCGCIPIVDPDDKLIGLITDRDVAMAAYTQGRPLAQICVEDVMSKPVHTCRPDEDLSIAQKRMRDHQLRRLPITDSTGSLIGLLSLNDLALEASRERGPGVRPQVRAADVAETLAVVSRHRGASQIVIAAE